MFAKVVKYCCVAAACVGIVAQAAAQGVTVIQGSGVSLQINAGQFAGVGQQRIGQMDVSHTTLTTLLSLAPGPGNTLVGQTTHTFDFGSLGSITTMDDLRLTPVNGAGLYQLSTRAVIVSGTGNFAGATGRMSFNGFANLATGQVTWMGHGQIR